MIFTGSTNTIATKTQTKLKGLNILYEEHQWFITYGMFIGEMFSLIGYVVHMVQKCKKKNAVENDSLVEEHHEGEEKPEASNFIFASTAMCDLLFSFLKSSSKAQYIDIISLRLGLLFLVFSVLG